MNRIVVVTIAVLIVAAIGFYAFSARDLTRARARLVGRSKTIETSFGTLEYAGDGRGPADADRPRCCWGL